MKACACLALILALPAIALADNPPPEAPKADLVTIPRSSLLDVLQVLQALSILHPEVVTPPVTRVFQRLNACLGGNPVGMPLQASAGCPELAQAPGSKDKAPDSPVTGFSPTKKHK